MSFGHEKYHRHNVWSMDTRHQMFNYLCTLSSLRHHLGHFAFRLAWWQMTVCAKLYSSLEQYIVQWRTFSVVWMLSTVILHQKVARLLDNQKFIVLKLFTWILQGFLCSKKLWSDNTLQLLLLRFQLVILYSWFMALGRDWRKLILLMMLLISVE